MKTDEEIIYNVKKIFSDHYTATDVVVWHEGDNVFVKITQMYNAPEHGLSMAGFVHEMCNAVGMADFVEYDTIDEDGCETCNYGSCYGTVFRFFDT